MALSDKQIERLAALDGKRVLSDGEMAELESLKGQASGASSQDADIRSRMEAQVAKDYPRSMGAADKMGMGMALEGGGGAIGQAVGASPMLAVPTLGLSVPVGGFIGGATGNLANQYAQRARGERTGISFSEAMGAGIASSIPGAPMAGAPIKAVAKEGLKQGTANLAGVTAQSLAEKGELPQIGDAMMAAGGGFVGAGVGRMLDAGAKPTAALKRQIDNAVRDETLSAARAAGYKVAPSQLSDAPAVARALEWLAGGPQTVAATENTARTANIALAKKSIGMPADKVLDLAALKQVRDQNGLVYDQAASVSNKAAAALDEFKTARDNARAYWLENKRQGTAASLKEAKAWDAQKKAAWNRLEAELNATNNSDLIPALQDARVTIAKTHLIEDAFNEGEGSVMADLIARRRKAGKAPTTDELEVMANFAQATGLKGGRPNKVSAVAHPLVAGGAIGSALMSGGTPAALGAGAAAIGGPMAAKAILLSNPVQNILMNPTYRTPMPMDLGAAMGSLAFMSAGRQLGQDDIRPVPYR